jgi:hypothetical protein
MDNAVEGIEVASAFADRAVEVYAGIILWMMDSKTGPAAVQTAFVAAKHAEGNWPDGVRDGEPIKDDDGNVQPMGLNAAYSDGCKAAKALMRFRPYVNQLLTTDSGQLKAKKGKAMLDPAKKRSHAGNSLIEAGIVEDTASRQQVGGGKGKGAKGGTTKGGVPEVLKALHAQLKDTEVSCSFEEGEDTWGDVITELATILEIKL